MSRKQPAADAMILLGAHRDVAQAKYTAARKAFIEGYKSCEALSIQQDDAAEICWRLSKARYLSLSPYLEPATGTTCACCQGYNFRWNYKRRLWVCARCLECLP